MPDVPTVETVASYGTTAGIGGVVYAFFRFLLQSRKQTTDEWQILISAMRQQIEALTREVADLRERVAVLSAENHDLRKLIVTTE